ncbi:MAG: HAMP domain-containing sensor histidine kinase [SAR324 cluster bacterium]|nr:HAMP domain-containing sensor histidine kinase [SAR324 cluster bacterium]MDP7137677.1 HAMP domain-containing sensor histidine kinase [SAR324 cluster bacterium]
MKTEWLRSSFTSLFTKLLLIMFGAGVLIVLTVASITWLMFDEKGKDVFRRNMNQYVSYLVRDLGIPPNRKRAEKLSDQLFINIHYKGPKISWKTSGVLPPLDQISFKKLQTNPGIEVGRYRSNRRVFRALNGEHTIYFHHRREIIPLTGWIWGAVLAIAILFWIFLTYLALRWVLQPIHWLSGGVEALASGNLEHRVRSDRKDELGKLTRGFNRMAERISTMLAARKQLLLDVSHELRSPMTRMKVALEMMPADALRKTLEEDLRMLESMVREILETARLESKNGRLNLQQLDLVELVKIFLNKYSKGKHEILLKESPKKLMIQADPEQITIVLENLLNNARRFSDEGSNPVEVKINEYENKAVLSVRDHGIGIPADELTMIFEPFYQIDKSRIRDSNHYGLGLNLCKSIAEAHNGSIRVESVEGSGSTFHFEIPCYSRLSDRE